MDSCENVARKLSSETLAALAAQTDAEGLFPQRQWQALADAGLAGIAIARDYGGLDLLADQQARVFEILSQGCLTSAFVLCQHHVCTALIASSPSETLRQLWLPGLASGMLLGANGINFLNLPAERAPMKAEPTPDGFRLHGTLPWTTAAARSAVLAAGAVLADGRQMVAAVPMASPGVGIDRPLRLLALTGSETTSVHLDDYFVPSEAVLLGPDRDVLKKRKHRPTAYVPTYMALGHAQASMDFLPHSRSGIARDMYDWLREQIDALRSDLTEVWGEDIDVERMPILRGRANVLAARAAHLALIGGGGTGYRSDGVPARLYREAGFFSVWSVSGSILPETWRNLS